MLFRRNNKPAAGADDARSETASTASASMSLRSSFKVLRPRGGGCMNCTMLDTFDDRDPIRRYRPAKGSAQEEKMKERLNQKDGEPAYEPPANSFALGTSGGAGAGGAGGGAGAGGSSC